MNKFTFTCSAWVGFILSIIGVGGLTVLTLFLPSHTAMQIIVCLIAGLYAAYLMHCSKAKSGRLLTPILWLFVSAVSFYTADLLTFALMQASFIWLVRCLYFHAGVLPALVDAALTLCSFGVAIWALGNSNWMLAFWSFFLVQSLSVWIPQPRTPARDRHHTTDDFARAAANAEAALKRITSSTS